MSEQKQNLAKKIYLYLAAIFITSLVVSNLIFQKFFYWYPFDMTIGGCLLYTSPSPRDRTRSRMPSSA